MPLTIEVLNDVDIFAFQTDMIGMKYAQNYHGLDQQTVIRLADTGHPEFANDPPKQGQNRVLPSHGVFVAPYIHVVGTARLRGLDYAGIRELGFNFLALITDPPSPVKHITVTMHGAGFGLKPIDSFRAQVLGMVDAYNKGLHPPGLERITFIERVEARANIMTQELDRLIADHPAVQEAMRESQIEEAPSLELTAPTRGVQKTSPQTRDHDIFVSYARVDSSIALRLSDELAGQHFSIWIDQINIRPGDHWDRAVQNALKESEIMLLVLTSASAASGNVADEYHYFLQNTKLIIPILAGDFDMPDMPYRLSRLQYIDFREEFEKGLSHLTETLQDIIRGKR